MKTPVQVAITGAAGQIAYSILFRITSGEMLGPDQPVILRCLEITSAMQALVGVGMEIEGCAFPLMARIVLTDDPNEAFKDTDIAMLIGARPRNAGMERSDLLKANDGIFKVQGETLNKNAKSDVKIVIVGNPANTNAHTAMRFAPDLNQRNFTALTRLDHNRALSQLVDKTKSSTREIKKIIIWGNHLTT